MSSVTSTISIAKLLSCLSMTVMCKRQSDRLENAKSNSQENVNTIVFSCCCCCCFCWQQFLFSIVLGWQFRTKKKKKKHISRIIVDNVMRLKTLESIAFHSFCAWIVWYDGAPNEFHIFSCASFNVCLHNISDHLSNRIWFVWLLLISNSSAIFCSNQKKKNIFCILLWEKKKCLNWLRFHFFFFQFDSTVAHKIRGKKRSRRANYQKKKQPSRGSAQKWTP